MKYNICRHGVTHEIRICREGQEPQDMIWVCVYRTDKKREAKLWQQIPEVMMKLRHKYDGLTPSQRKEHEEMGLIREVEGEMAGWDIGDPDVPLPPDPYPELTFEEFIQQSIESGSMIQIWPRPDDDEE